MLPNKLEALEEAFPQLAITDYRITSPITKKYNCIAWAAGDDDNFWWPSPYSFWPEGVVRELNIESFILAYESVGYQVCDDYAYEDGFEKIAIFTDSSDQPTHAARQIDGETWTSKLGRSYDISHTFHGVTGEAYGTPVIFMKRIKTG